MDNATLTALLDELKVVSPYIKDDTPLFLAENDPFVAKWRQVTVKLPWPPGSEPQGDPRVAAIGAAARRLVELRDGWLNPPDADEATLRGRTLTNLYNQRPAWLANAHTKLDRAVCDAYGWPGNLSDEQILEKLLALNLARSAGRGR